MANYTEMNNALKELFKRESLRAPNALVKIQAKFLARGASGIKGAQMRFKIMDDDRSRSLSFDEFSKGIKDVGLRDMSDEDLKYVFAYFDKDASGTINFDEFLKTIQPAMNERRRKLVVAAFIKMDRTGDGKVTVEDMTMAYNVKEHPKVKNGEWTDTRAYKEYLSTFEAENQPDGVVTLEEFASYYASISCSIENDMYFDLMMRNSWGELIV